MNYLAHALLAGDDRANRCGGVAGDFIKGLLPGGLPPALAAGVALHRRIDSFADAHPAFRQSRTRVSPARRRLAGIMVDVFYDHLLAVHWSRFCDEPLESYTEGLYAELHQLADFLPPRFGEVLPRMHEHNWLLSYRSADNVGLALDRMALHRLRQPNNLAGAGEELLRDYAGFEADFLAFFPDALRFSEVVRAGRSLRFD
ncbi:MAG: DUF479 domain-containing protein [Zoogloeaceae bacterium]|nr:DUF479 domain-containing protein [Zoogloeaceae bacterium]